MTKHVYVLPRNLVIGWLVSFACMMVLTGAALQYTNYYVNKSNRDWCALVMFYVNYYQENPPTTEIQKQQAELMIDRASTLDCE